MSNFEICFNSLMQKEGLELTNTNGDRGGLTKFGISKRAYPSLDIANLTIDMAKSIYKTDYWDKMKLDNVDNSIIAKNIFEAAVNFGIFTVVCIVQKILDVKVDGKIGDVTIKAINSFDDTMLFLALLKLSFVDRYRQICNNNKDQKIFLLGWLNRIFE